MIEETELTIPVERTALLTAALRAAETQRPDRLYEDPYAATLVGEIGPRLLAQVRAATFPPGRERTLPSTPDYNAIRTRHFDELLMRYATELSQVVLAPAGMDSRAYRLSWPGHIRYFEVDRPAVLEFKRQRLGGLRPGVDHRTVAVDMTSPAWETGLIAAGYDPATPSIWLLEGFLYYLTERDADRVLGRITAIMAPGSRLAADIVNAAALTLPNMQGLLSIFAEWGCPWRFGTDEPMALFEKHGLTHVAGAARRP